MQGWRVSQEVRLLLYVFVTDIHFSFPIMIVCRMLIIAYLNLMMTHPSLLSMTDMEGMKLLLIVQSTYLSS